MEKPRIRIHYFEWTTGLKIYRFVADDLEGCEVLNKIRENSVYGNPLFCHPFILDFKIYDRYRKN